MRTIFGRSEQRGGGPERLQFQVVLRLVVAEPASQEDLELAFEQGLEALLVEAQGIALGSVGGIDFTTNTIELELTMEAISPTVFYAKMGEVLRVLERAGFEYAGSKQERLDGPRGFELRPA